VRKVGARGIRKKPFTLALVSERRSVALQVANRGGRGSPVGEEPSARKMTKKAQGEGEMKFVSVKILSCGVGRGRVNCRSKLKRKDLNLHNLTTKKIGSYETKHLAK